MLILSRENLIRLYTREGKSSNEIAKVFGCSTHKVNYWLKKYGVPKRTISDAIYLLHNPTGDPFAFREPKSRYETKLFGLGIGLYWGEGTKASKTAVRLGNTDPALIKTFVEFLKRIYQIDTERLRFGLQIFSDMNPAHALDFWTKSLRVKRGQFQKVVVTRQRGRGTYRRKMKYGVVTVYFNNRKLRDIINNEIARVAQVAEHDHGKIGVASASLASGSR